jgi:TolB-like protein/DNA-binding winged helix-turn-helix (wHTH) protein
MDTGQFAQFGVFVFDLKQRVLTREGDRVPLAPKDLETLLVLIRGHGQIVEKKQIMEEIWPETFVEEANLSRHVFNLRRILSGGGEPCIETIPKRGYRFVAPVHFHSEAPRIAADSYTSSVGDAQSTHEPQTPPASEYCEDCQTDRNHSTRRSLLRPRILIFALGAFLAAGVVFGLLRAWAFRPISIAILPVQNLTGNTAKGYISDGLTEELIYRAAAVKRSNLTVVPLTSSMAYKTTTKTAAEIARDLQVDYLIEGTLRESPGRLRITAKLIRFPEQKLVWVREYDRAQTDVLGMEDEISQLLIELLPIHEFSVDQSSAARIPPDAH